MSYDGALRDAYARYKEMTTRTSYPLSVTCINDLAQLHVPSGHRVTVDSINAVVEFREASMMPVDESTCFRGNGGVWVQIARLPTKDDKINSPSHYTSHPAGIECITVIEHFPCNIANAMKYLWRQGLKEGESNLDDLKKAEWYVKREIERVIAMGEKAK